jgi:hypothetical protein
VDRSSLANRMRCMHPNRAAKLAIAIGFSAPFAAPALALGHRAQQPAPPTASPVTLPALPAGWTVLTDSPQNLTPAGTHVETLIVSWHYRTSAFGPASAIPPGGTMISVALSRSQAYRARKVNLCETTAKYSEYPPRTFPLRLPNTTRDTLDGQPHVTEFRVFGRYRDSYNFELRVDIDTRRPVEPRRSAAQAIVHGLRFPKWPTEKAC